MIINVGWISAKTNICILLRFQTFATIIMCALNIFPTWGSRAAYRHLKLN